MRYQIAFAILVVTLYAVGYSLSSDIPDYGKQKPTGTNAINQKAQTVEQLPQSPVVIRNYVTDNHQQVSTNPTQTENNEKKTDWWIVYATVALAVVGSLQLFAFILQAKRLKQTINVMKDTTQRQLRAYVCISGGTIKFDRKDAPVVHVEYKNSGQTPAYDVCGWHHIWITGYPLTEELPEPPKSFTTSQSIIPPGGHAFILIPKDPPVPAQSVHLLGTPEGTIYIYGEIRYRDAFRVNRFTKYRLMYGGPEGIHGEHLKPHTEGNEAN
jgi:hypothetical protein